MKISSIVLVCLELSQAQYDGCTVEAVGINGLGSVKAKIPPDIIEKIKALCEPLIVEKVKELLEDLKPIAEYNTLQTALEHKPMLDTAGNFDDDISF